MLKLTFAIVICSASVVSSRAQTICSNTPKAQSLYCTPIAALQQFSVNEKASVSIPIPPAFTALNANIATEITALPTPSPVSGFLFSFGPGGLRSERDLGPIFSERTGTVEKHKLSIGSSYQFFGFDKVNELSLKQIPVQFGACTYGSEAGCTPYIETSSRLDLKAHRFTTYATFGITTKLDASVAIPFTNVRMGMNATCSVCARRYSPEVWSFSFTQQTRCVHLPASGTPFSELRTPYGRVRHRACLQGQISVCRLGMNSI